MSRRLAFLVACGLSSLVVAACGTITGLSDDYKYDLDATTSGGDGGGPRADASTDATSTVDASEAGPSFDAGQCSPSQSNQTENYLQSAQGSSECKGCLLSSCCPPVAACVQGGGNCQNRLDCDLKCTESAGAARTACLTACQASDPTSSPAFTMIKACSCQSKCGSW